MSLLGLCSRCLLFPRALNLQLTVLKMKNTRCDLITKLINNKQIEPLQSNTPEFDFSDGVLAYSLH